MIRIYLNRITLLNNKKFKKGISDYITLGKMHTVP